MALIDDLLKPQPADSADLSEVEVESLEDYWAELAEEEDDDYDENADQEGWEAGYDY